MDNELPPNTLVDTPVVSWLRERFLTMLANEPAEFPEPNQNDSSSDSLQHKPASDEYALPWSLHQQEEALFYLLSG